MGVTGMVDFEFSGGAPEWAERFAEGADLIRVRMATYADGLDDVIAAGLRTGDVLPGCDERITMGPLKVISDGSLNTRTAWCCDPYADGTGSGAAQPVLRRAARAARPRRRAPPRGRDARDRRRRRPRGAGRVRRHRRLGLDRARPADPARRRTPAGRPRHPGQRAARAPARRPRRHREGLAGPRRPLLRAALDARRRRHPGDGVGRAGLTRWIRGWRWPLPCTAAATSGSRGTPSRRSPRARRWPPRWTGRGPSRRARGATWCCSTPTRSPPARTRQAGRDAARHAGARHLGRGPAGARRRASRPGPKPARDCRCRVAGWCP